MASAAGRSSGAAEHTVVNEWRAALAYSNIGLAGNAFTSKKWYTKHRGVLLELFTKLLRTPVLGLLLNEVGNMSDLLTEEGKEKLQEVLMNAFKQAGATEHGPPQFFWSEGETMATFRAEVQVLALQPLTKMRRVDSWRVVERFELFGGPEHGSGSLLIYTLTSRSPTIGPSGPRSKLTSVKQFCEMQFGTAAKTTTLLVMASVATPTARCRPGPRHSERYTNIDSASRNQALSTA